MLSVEGLSFRYPGREEQVLNDISLSVPDGGIFGLLGPNGAGKTTLISILSGQLRAAAGRIGIDGEALESLRERRPHCLGLVPQELAFYPMLTALENLRFFGGVQGMGAAPLKRRVDAVDAGRDEGGTVFGERKVSVIGFDARAAEDAHRRADLVQAFGRGDEF